MNEMLKNWWSKLAPFWNRYSKAQRRNIAVAVNAGLLCLVVILWVVLRPHYVTVMSGLDDKTLGAVDSKLKELKIPDKINGSSIEVPSSDADKARIQIAMAGVLDTGYIGYSSIKNSFGMTKDQFDVQVLDVLQQSLNHTIESIDGIQSAQVHIVPPDQQLFVSQPDSTAKASVFIQVGQGVRLSAAQVAGIQQLVAHSVKGLTPDNVTVTDQNGMSLSSQTDPSAAGGDASDELQIRQKYESDMQAKLAQGLSQIVGPGNSVVVVHANITFDKKTSNSEIYQPAPGSTTGLISSTQTDRKSSTTTSGGGAGGAAGQSTSNPNLPTYAGTGGSGGNSTSTETQSSTNYDNSKIQQTTVSDPVQINGYNVSVLLNSQDKNLTKSVVQQIRDFVATSVGKSAAAGASSNDITVSTVPFQTPAMSSVARGNFPAYWYAVIGGGALLLIGLILWLMRRRRSSETEAMMEPVSTFEPLDSRPLTDDERMKEELARLAQRKPDEFVSLLRTWLASD